MAIVLNCLIVLSIVLSPASLVAEPEAAGNRHPASLANEPVPVLSLTKSADTPEASPAQVVTFDLAIANDGPHTAQNLTLQDTLPRGLFYVRGSAPQASYDRLSRTLTWALPALDAGQEVVLSYQARILALPGQELATKPPWTLRACLRLLLPRPRSRSCGLPSWT